MAALDWAEVTAEIPEKGLHRQRRATAEECARVASALEVPACSRLEARYRVQLKGRGRYLLDGTVEADVTQECVVTVEPVDARLKFEIEVEFTADVDVNGDEVIDPFARMEVEPIENGRLAVGRVVLEELASNLDPYPRRPDSHFDWRDEAADKQAGPFAELARLTPKKPGAR